MSATDTPPAVTRDGFTIGTLPPGPVSDLLAEAMDLIPDEPERLYEIALEAEEVADSDLGRAFARVYQGFARYLLSDHVAAADLLTRALADMEPSGDLAGRSLALGGLASVHVSLGHYDEALELALENLSAARILGDVEREAWVLATMGNTYLELGQTSAALENGEQALRLFAGLDNAGGQARAHTVLGGALRELERLAEALAHHEAALRLAREQGASLSEARALDDLGQLARLRGDFEEALSFHRHALRLRGVLGNRQAQATSLIAIGRTLTAMGKPDDARPALEEALGIAQDVGAEPRVSEAHAALSDAHEAGGDFEGALRHLRAHYAAREALLSAKARSRIHSIEVRAEAEQARRDAEISRLRTVELAELNESLQTALDDLRAMQGQLVQSEKLASLGRLSAGLAHEIQNPLNFVANFGELNVDLATDLLEAVRQVEASGEPPDLEAFQADLEDIVANAGRVRDHARRAESIVSGLMGHVRDVGGERRPTDIHELLEGGVSRALGRSDLRIERDYADDVHPLDVVPASIQRVFVNLLENARWSVDRAAAGGIEVADDWTPTVRLSTERYDGGVEIRIADNGIGIKAADCVRVFEPFFTTKPAGTGTGLGLSLAYDIVSQGHGGTLAAHSREGQGATFMITLPS
ncbi:tetratricopeptide repeat protein [Rubrivirga sp.]|uniref:tetratricopeptide repeat protein n=1 Tax=Rubrivirga sp. TaxID=1885344 RepID=UPI003C78CA38